MMDVFSIRETTRRLHYSFCGIYACDFTGILVQGPNVKSMYTSACGDIIDCSKYI